MSNDKVNHSQLASLIWNVADLLRGNFRQNYFGRIILPFTLLRRLECVLEPTKEHTLATYSDNKEKPENILNMLLMRASGNSFYNTSKLKLETLSDRQTAEDLISYIQSFSADAREIFEYFKFEDFILQLASNNLLYLVVKEFATFDLSPKNLSNYGMGIVFEELIRKFAESSNDTAGEYFTPRDIVHLVTSLVLTGEEERLKPNSIISVYDPTAGTGGFLSEGDEYIQSVSNNVSVALHGQELNPESYAICKAEMLIKGQDVSNIKLGDTLADDQLQNSTFDIMLSNPPFGVDWKKIRKTITDEHTNKGFDGRFGAGLPRVSDGSLLFLMHLVSKMRDRKEGGSRIGIVLNGSPLFTGGAGSGESEIRRYLLQHDLVEAIVALPTDMFYNTGIATYVWILSNNKPAERQGKVQLIDATDKASKMRKSLGSKRNYIEENDQDEIVRLYGNFAETQTSKIFPIEAFGYRRITVERPLQLNFQTSAERIDTLFADEKNSHYRKLTEENKANLRQALESLDANKLYLNRDNFTKDLTTALKAQSLNFATAALRWVITSLSEQDENADICLNAKGEPEADTSLRDYENIPLLECANKPANQGVYEYFEREVLPHVPNAWIDESKCDPQDEELGVVGFEIPFNRHFYEFVPPRPLAEIDAELKASTDKIRAMLDGLSA